MTKKIFIIFTFVLLIFGITKVQALSKWEQIDITKENLETLIETKETDSWEDLNVDKCSKEGMIIYKAGNNSLGKNQIDVNEYLEDERIMRIIKNGYKKKAHSEIGVNSPDDAYIATKIAIDSVLNDYKVEEVANHYRAKENLDETLTKRANDIIQAAINLLELGYVGDEIYLDTIIFGPVGTFKTDNIKKDYSSQLYRVEVEGATLTGYKITEKSESDVNYFIANADTGEEQEEFKPEETNFKIMVPNEEVDKLDRIDIWAEIYYDTEDAFIGTDGTNKYFILSEESKTLKTDTILLNIYSNLTVNFLDEETGEKIYGCTVQIDGINYTVNEDNQKILEGIMDGTLNMKVVHMPDEYTIDNTNIKMEIQYKEDHVENISLKRKKGNLEIITKAVEATYEIYDNELNIVGTYETDEEGKIYVEELNTGKYTIKQIKVKEGYILSGDNIIEIPYNDTCYVTIINKEEEKKQEDIEIPEENTEEDKEEISEEVVPPKEENVPEKVEGTEENIQEKTDEISNEAEVPKEESKENNDNAIEEKTEETTEDESEKTVGDKMQEDNEKSTMSTLPRTGNDYFIFKIILADLNIFLFIRFLINKNS